MKKLIFLIMLFIFIMSINAFANAATLPEGGIRAILNLNETPINARLIDSISFVDNVDVSEGSDYIWNVATGIVAWVVSDSPKADDKVYSLYIGSNENIYAPTNCARYFENLLVNNIDLQNFHTNNVTNMDFLFASCPKLYSLDLTNMVTTNVVSMMGMFYECYHLRTITFDFAKFNTSRCTNMRYMFESCYSIAELDLSGFNTSRVTDMMSMFQECSSLKRVVLSSFNTTSAKYMDYMFRFCTSLSELDLSNFSTKNLVSASGMFSGCSNLKSIVFDIFGEGSGIVSTTECLFEDCVNLESITTYVPENSSNVSDATDMFKNCEKLNSIIVLNDSTNTQESFCPFWKSDSKLDEIEPTLYVKNDETKTKIEANEDYMNMFGSNRIKVYAQEETEPISGDLDHDGEITIMDIRLLVQQFINL